MTAQMTTKYIAIAITHSGQKLRALPRSKKTALFTSLSDAELALDKLGRKIGGGRGVVYATPHTVGNDPVLTIAI